MSKISISPAPPHPTPPPTPVVFLLTVTRRLVCCSSFFFARLWFHMRHICVCVCVCVCVRVYVVLSCSTSLLLLVPREGLASWLLHFLGSFTYMTWRTTKPTIRLVRPAKTQISLRIRAVWSESSLIACAFNSLQAIQRAIRELLPYWVNVQLIRVFADHTGLTLGFVVCWLIFVMSFLSSFNLYQVPWGGLCSKIVAFPGCIPLCLCCFV